MISRGQTSARTVSDVVLKHRSKGGRKGPRLPTVHGSVCLNDQTTRRYAKGTSLAGRCVECVRRRVLASHHLGSNRRAQIKLADPKHPYNHRNRERQWAQQRIAYLGVPLSWAIYEEILEYQDHRCAVCGRNFRLWTKRAAVVDHDHKTGEVRGVLCGGKLGCNLHLLGRYENGHTKNLNEAAIFAIRAYLADPPVKRYTRDRAGE